MTARWTEKQINHQKDILRNQLETGSGRFGMFVLRTFKFIENECQKNNSNWCYANKVGGKKLIAYVYNGPEDHMGYSVVEDVKANLKKMGYIRYKKENDVWKLYVEKNIDFCDIDQYVLDNPESPDFYQRVYDHLLQSGIKIYKYRKTCWKCGKQTDIYTYFLGKQLESEMGKEYMPHRYYIKNGNLFDRIGLGSITALDKYLATIYPTIKVKFSKQMGESYYMNCCQYCDAHQGINYTVYRPIELMETENINIKKYECNSIDIELIGLNKTKIKDLY